jgi:hypothetical protein
MNHTPLHHHFNDGIFRGIGSAEPCARCVLERAAPDLLDCLRLAVARIELANQEGDPIMSAWLIDARAAIAKAEGKP